MRLQLGLQQLELRLGRLALRRLGLGAGAGDLLARASQPGLAHKVIGAARANRQAHQQQTRALARSQKGQATACRVAQQCVGYQGTAEVAQHHARRHDADQPGPVPRLVGRQPRPT